MSFTAFPRDVFVEVDHILVLHLHKVYLDARNAPFLIYVQNLGYTVVHERSPESPKYHAHPFRTSIGDDFVKVKSVLRLHYVKGGLAPALIHKNIRKTVFGCEIDIVFIRLGIYPGLEVHAIDIEHSPPLPADFSWFEP